MKNKSVLIIFSLILFSSLSLVTAEKIIQVESTGLTIDYPKFDTVEIGQPFQFNIHVFNSSTGIPVTNETVDCYLHGYYRNGTHVLKVELNFDPPFDFYYDIPKEIFTGGKGGYIVQCNNSEGGFVSASFDVTRTGFEFTVEEAIVYSILSFGILLLSIISFYFLIITPYSNKLNEKGNLIMKVTRTKYIKLGLIMITWGLFTWFLNIMIGLADSFSRLTMYYGLFEGIFFIMNALSLPLSIVIIVIMLFEIVRDANIQKHIKKFGSAQR